MLPQNTIEQSRNNGRLDVVKLANSLGIEVRPFTDIKTVFSKENAFIKYDAGKFYIFVNPSQTKQRQRFSIAHELAHYATHRDDIIKNGKVDREWIDSLSKGKEEEADKFAAELLVPADDLKDYIQKNNFNGQKIISKEVVETLAERYDVSLFAMILRLRELSYYVPYINVYA